MWSEACSILAALGDRRVPDESLSCRDFGAKIRKWLWKFQKRTRKLEKSKNFAVEGWRWLTLLLTRPEGGGEGTDIFRIRDPYERDRGLTRINGGGCISWNWILDTKKNCKYMFTDSVYEYRTTERIIQKVQMKILHNWKQNQKVYGK